MKNYSHRHTCSDMSFSSENVDQNFFIAAWTVFKLGHNNLFEAITLLLMDCLHT